MRLEHSKELLWSYVEPERVDVLKSFFKTRKGEYAENDKFLGVRVPKVRRVARKSKDLVEADIVELLKSEWHEERLLGLMIIDRRFRFAKPDKKKYWVDFYLENLYAVNNWDLVDLSADKILGEYVLLDATYEKKMVEFAKSFNLWHRRIAIVATLALMKRRRSDLTYKIALILLRDKEDLIQKAVGWMLREAGKRVNDAELIEFLREHKAVMPRTMLRYAIERLSEEVKVELMSKNL
jgi:3-methyladenine DNA glycosylase AlkD